MSLRAQDEDGTEVPLQIEWFVNGRSHSTGALRRLDTHDLRRDDEVYAIVRASKDGRTSSVQTPSVRLANTTPEVTQVKLFPDEPVASEPLMVEAVVQDPDGDPYELSYRWEVNGRLLEGESGPTLPEGKVKRRDELRVSVAATDTEQGTWFVSRAVRVVNARPEITSTPATTLSSGNNYQYQIDATDPDGDRPLRYELVRGPDGMTVDPISGLVEWTVPFDANGTFPIELAVRDAYGGEATQRYALDFRWESSPASSDERGDGS